MSTAMLQFHYYLRDKKSLSVDNRYSFCFDDCSNSNRTAYIGSSLVYRHRGRHFTLISVSCSLLFHPKIYRGKERLRINKPYTAARRRTDIQALSASQGAILSCLTDSRLYLHGIPEPGRTGGPFSLLRLIHPPDQAAGPARPYLTIIFPALPTPL